MATGEMSQKQSEKGKGAKGNTQKGKETTVETNRH